MKHILAVYDVDPVYAARFAEVVNQKEKIPFEVVAFSSIERLRAFAAEHPVKLLLLGEHVPAEEKESIRAYFRIRSFYTVNPNIIPVSSCSSRWQCAI